MGATTMHVSPSSVINMEVFQWSILKIPASFLSELCGDFRMCTRTLRLPVHVQNICFIQTWQNSGRKFRSELWWARMKLFQISRLIFAIIMLRILYVYGRPKGARTLPEILLHTDLADFWPKILVRIMVGSYEAISNFPPHFCQNYVAISGSVRAP